MFLFVTDRKDFGASVEPHFSASGLLVYYARPDAARLLCDKKDVGGVIVDLIRARADATATVLSLRGAYPDLPLAAIAPVLSRKLLAAGITPIPDGNPAKTVSAAEDFFRDACGWDPAPLETHDLTLSPVADGVSRYMGYDFLLSPRERRLLYCLYYRAPLSTPVDDLLALCYPFSPAAAPNVAAVIRKINLRAASLDPRPLICRASGGYRLRDLL